MTIGVRLESLGLPFRPALSAAMKSGATGVQFDAVGHLHPDRLSATGRREIGHLLRSYDLEATALHCPLRHGLDQPANMDARIEHLKKALSLSRELGAGIVVIDAGALTHADADPRAAILREALSSLGAHATRVGATLALESGLEAGDRVAGFLNRLPAGGIGVNYDPGNLLLNGFDPVAQIAPLKKYLVHAHAHDGKRGSASQLERSAPLGGGDVDWLAVVGTLAAAEYHGWIVVELDEPNGPAAEAGVKFLKRLI